MPPRNMSERPRHTGLRLRQGRVLNPWAAGPLPVRGLLGTGSHRRKGPAGQRSLVCSYVRSPPRHRRLSPTPIVRRWMLIGAPVRGPESRGTAALVKAILSRNSQDLIRQNLRERLPPCFRWPRCWVCRKVSQVVRRATSGRGRQHDIRKWPRFPEPRTKAKRTLNEAKATTRMLTNGQMGSE